MSYVVDGSGTTSNVAGKVKLRTKIATDYVLPEEVEQREVVFGNYEKCMYIKDNDGNFYKFTPVDDSDNGSTYRTWSAYKINLELNSILTQYKNHDHNDMYFTRSTINLLLSGKSDTTHNHDSAYYLKDQVYIKSEVVALVNTKADTLHYHDTRYYKKTETDSYLVRKVDKPTTYVAGNIVLFDNDGNIYDSGKTIKQLSTVVKTQITDFKETDYVHSTTDETINGMKTFTVSPIIPTEVLTSPAQACSKKHLEDALVLIDGGTF